MQLYSKIQGNGEDILLLHGLFGSHENLGVIQRHLVNRGYRVHGIDLRNHGRSFWSDIMDYPTMASDILAYMNEKKLESASLIGHSMGGKVAMQLTLDHPDRICKLVIIDIAPVTYLPSHNNELRGMSALDIENLSTRQEADGQLKRLVPELPIRQFLLKNLRPRNNWGYQWRINLTAITHAYRNILNGIDPSTIPCINPALFLKGEASAYIQTEHHAAIKQFFPHYQLACIPGARHWLHVDAPQAVCQHITHFIE
ncbi:Esterase YbfF [invertebrate metagenome]|uniref:Esterase YbfF n=1 Tax=invertebrate metagenome TaxID=1711999 RepID=A0A2H9TCJ8_9ZZZZ